MKLTNLVRKISDDMQNLESLLQAESIESVNIRFPRGVIRTADHFRNRLSFVNDYVLKTNIAYHLMLTDVYRWILNRFDISLTAQEMLIKEGISLIGNIIEAILKHISKHLGASSPDIGFSKTCTILVEHNIISKEQKKNLEWVWGIMRCKEHIFTLPNAEYGKYTLEHYNRVIQVWRDLERSLQKAKNEGLI